MKQKHNNRKYIAGNKQIKSLRLQIGINREIKEGITGIYIPKCKTNQQHEE